MKKASHRLDRRDRRNLWLPPPPTQRAARTSFDGRLDRPNHDAARARAIPVPASAVEEFATLNVYGSGGMPVRRQGGWANGAVSVSGRLRRTEGPTGVGRLSAKLGAAALGMAWASAGAPASGHDGRQARR